RANTAAGRMRVAAALLACAALPALGKTMVADVPWTGATTCLLTVAVTQSPNASAAPTATVSREFPVTVDATRGKSANGNRVCVDDPLQWPVGYTTIPLRLRRASDGAVSSGITERFGP